MAAPDPSTAEAVVQFLLGKPLVMGGLTWIGFVVAIVQATRAQRAAAAAAAATARLTSAVQSRERLLELSAALGHLDAARNHIGHRDYGKAVVFLEFARRECVQAQQLLAQGPQKRQLYKVIVRLTELTEVVSIDEGDARQEETAVLRGIDARGIVDALNEILAQLRYTYGEDGQNNAST
jgi:hypothetical protein